MYKNINLSSYWERGWPSSQGATSIQIIAPIRSILLNAVLLKRRTFNKIVPLLISFYALRFHEYFN